MVDISSPDKVMFPDAGITKGTLIGYYATVAERMVPLVAGRPVTLHRFPSGIGGKGFFQKNAADYFPDHIETVELPKADGGTTEYAVIDEPDDLVYLANQNTITFHVGTARLPDLNIPDRILFDLDPDAGDVARVREAAGAIAHLLDDLGLDRGLPMTTGSKGYHVHLAIEPGPTYDTVSLFTRHVAELAAHAHPDLLTTEFHKKNRKGRVFVDWLRNSPGATGVAPWSVRARPGAPVAVPITWDEVATVAPDEFSLASAGPLLERPALLDTLSPVAIDDAAAEAARRIDEAGIELKTFDRFRS